MNTRRGGARRKPEVSPEDLDRLVEEVKSGDVEAFERLYGLYGRKIVNYIYRMTGSRAEAEDLAQETFILAFRKIGTLKDNRRVQSWLFRIAQNNVYQRYRGKKPQIESIDESDAMELADVQKLASPIKGPQENLLSEELREMVDRVIAELPEKYREVFVLSAMHRLSYVEIAEIVGRSLASVKSDIHRARVKVRQKIKGYLGENYGMSGIY